MRASFWLILFFSLPSFSQRESPENVEIYEYMQLKANDDTASISIGTFQLCLIFSIESQFVLQPIAHQK